MLPRTIVSVLDSSDVVKDVAIAWAVSLARWYESDLHVVHVRRSGRSAAAVENARRNEVVGRIHRIVDASGAAGVNVIPAALSSRPGRAIADYSRRVAADLVVVTNKARRSNGYWLAGSFAAALGKAVPSPTIVLPDSLPLWVGPGSPFRSIVSAIVLYGSQAADTPSSPIEEQSEDRSHSCGRSERVRPKRVHRHVSVHFLSCGHGSGEHVSVPPADRTAFPSSAYGA